MPREGLEPTILVSERAKTVQALDHAATVIGRHVITRHNLQGDQKFVLDAHLRPLHGTACA
jgi:hypothetical protein